MKLADRRLGKDRRAKPTSPFTPASLRGRRKAIRRDEDRGAHYYVDLYSLNEVLIFTLILILTVADAFLTLVLVGNGAAELNHVMDYYLRLGPVSFVIVKYLLTAVSLVWLIIFKNYPLFRGKLSVKSIMVGVAITYVALITYELLLIRRSY